MTKPNAAEINVKALECAQEQNTLTLATSDQGKPWAAPVYYVYQASAFYFLSDPKTRHIQESAESGQAAAAIHAPSFDWQEIRGLQMSGQIERVEGKIETLKAVGTYLLKFPFVQEFFTPGVALDMASFEKRFSVRLYKFQPSLTYYLDNKIRFGFREEVQLG
ncbi:MAG: pyridoxamine 5'-phosphate oxidase family protein [Rhodospirillales bacterium]|nr:pyridoxamine 5'-phosphate oxidase family protein [Rhodospirillales bacterium]